MSVAISKRRRGEEDVRRPKKKIRIRKQKAYHSSSEDEDEDGTPTAQEQRPQEAGPKSILKQPAPQDQVEDIGQDEESEVEGLSDLDEADRNAALNIARGADEAYDDDEMNDEEADDLAGDLEDLQDSDVDEDEDDEFDIQDSESLTSSQAAAVKKKRNDPDAFATSISKILTTKLSTAKRPDPVLSRSATAASASKSLQDEKLDVAARAQIRAERKKMRDKGRIADVLGLGDANVDTGAVQEEEKRLKKIAQRGVVKLFNAVRAAQVGAERAAKEGVDEGVVGRKSREEKVSEMSKEGFLEMISRGRGSAAV